MNRNESTGDARAVARTLRELPMPDEVALAASSELVALLCAELERAGGVISFARFMELALYAPGLGYYSGGSHKFGEGGDFITAPELSPLFSRCVARQAMQILEQLDGGDLLEFGAGSGVMAADILAELERLGHLPEHYFIVELSGELRQRQQQTLVERVPQLLERVSWLDELPTALRGVIIGNEVLDAMPVHRFSITDGVPQEIGVAWQEGRFVDAPLPQMDSKIAAKLTTLQMELQLDEGYHSEINPVAEEWIATLAEMLTAGAVLLIDYGFARREYYHPQRHDGTLMCHYRHRAHADPYWLPGLQDITAHVDFTAMAEAADCHGLQVAGFTTQANFLLASGLLEMAAEPRELREQLECANQVRRLTMPGEMGELFKVLALTRAIEGPLLGFTLRDDRARL